MPTVYDIPANKMIDETANYLKYNVDKIKPPPWASIIKTGCFAERHPQSKDWWYLRCASILRKIYLKEPIGISRLRSLYGGRKDRGVAIEKSVKGSGSILRKALQQLEEAGYIKIVDKKGRVITPKGRKLLDEIASKIMKELTKELPELAHY